MKTFLSLLAASCQLFAFAPAMAADFSVNPIRLELGAEVRSGAINVRNESTGKINFQLQAMAWTQDAEGKDRYEETSDLVYFPRIMTIEPGQEAVVRVGIRQALQATEKTYRLFIEELAPAATDAAGAQINMLIRFGAPVFVAPLKPEDGLVIEGLDLSQSVLKLTARNTGNRHQVVQGIAVRGTDATGSDVYALTLADRYLLTGTAKGYTTTVPAEQCKRMTGLSVEVKTDKRSVTQRLPVTPAMCR